MLNYQEINLNPKGHKTGDCCVRAIAGTLGISYEQAIDECAFWAKKKCYGITDKQTVELVLRQHGYVKMKQPRKRDNTKYLVRELDEIIPQRMLNEGVLVTVANHHTCIKNGVIQDIWDCGRKTVGNYYIKAREVR